MSIRSLSGFTYEDLLNIFLQVKENLPAIINHVYVAIDNLAVALKLIGELVPETESLYMPSPEELALEGQLAVVYSGESQALFSGEALRRLFKLVKDNPKLLEILLTLLVPKAAVTAEAPASAE